VSFPRFSHTVVSDGNTVASKFPLGKRYLDTDLSLFELVLTDLLLKHVVGLCEGDCDSDSDCESGLKCFLRSGFKAVPGCSGRGHNGADYCYKPVSTLKDIVDTAIAAGSFSTLVTAVTAAGLVETLRSPGPFTVFAPTDAAFKLLPAGVLQGLLADKDDLTAVLTYHVVSGKITAADAIKAAGTSIVTVNGAKIKVTVVNGKVKINDATVVIADVMASVS
jgi:hypothetical protein